MKLTALIISILSVVLIVITPKYFYNDFTSAVDNLILSFLVANILIMTFWSSAIKVKRFLFLSVLICAVLTFSFSWLDGDNEANFYRLFLLSQEKYGDEPHPLYVCVWVLGILVIIILEILLLSQAIMAKKR